MTDIPVPAPGTEGETPTPTGLDALLASLRAIADCFETDGGLVINAPPAGSDRDTAVADLRWLASHLPEMLKRIDVEDFTAFIGNGENSLGRFPANLSELHDALQEFAGLAHGERTHG